MAFCLSLFIHPCASSPDQLRQEEPHAHWGHLSLLFTGLTKAARVFPGCRWPAFHLPASIRTSAAHTSLETWNREGETAKTAIILTHFKCVVSCARNGEWCSRPDSKSGIKQLSGKQGATVLIRHSSLFVLAWRCWWDKLRSCTIQPHACGRGW